MSPQPRRRGRTRQTLAASPTLIGAVTVLIVTVAVFLAYNANSGLPFVPTYNLKADIPNANTLVPGNDVRIGGVRVGFVESIEPIPDNEDGTAFARLGLKLDEDVAPLPVDSTLIVRARSALGLKYVEINRGSSAEGYRSGATIPIEAATPEPVEIDELLNTFNEPTRVAIQENLFEFGNALAGRGPAINSLIGELRPLLPRLESVMVVLGDPQTRLGRFVQSLAAAAAEVAPVARQQAEMFVNLDTTFTALASVARPYIQETIAETPPTLDQGIQSLPVIRPFLDNSAGLFAELQPGARALEQNAPAIAEALETGTPVLARAPILNEQLGPTTEALVRFAEDEGVNDGIARLRLTAGYLGPTLRFITPAQDVCNYGSLLARNVSSAWSYGDGLGTWQRFTVFNPPSGPNNEGSPSSAPAQGGDPTSQGDANFLHINPYPNTAAPGQPFECEAGNEGYAIGRLMIGNVPGNQGTLTEDQLPR